MTNTELLFNVLKGMSLKDKNNFIIQDNNLYNCENKTLTKKYDRKCSSINLEFKKIQYSEVEIWNFLTFIANNITAENLNKIKVTLFNQKDYKHNSDNNFINLLGTSSTNFSLQTGNVIGFIQKDKHILNITSRFGDKFLQYIVADSDGFLEIEKLGAFAHQNNYHWLIACLFKQKLQQAYSIGLPKQYTKFTQRTLKVKGNIDNIDFYYPKVFGKYLCTYKEHSYQTKALLLFIKAYESLSAQQLLFSCRNIYADMLRANQGFDCTNKELFNLDYFNNSLYSNYNELIDLSKKVLKFQSNNISNEQQCSGFLFDISMLFEYFIAKLLKKNNIHVLNKSSDKKIPTGGNTKKEHILEPDIVFKENNKTFIFDIKYKKFDFDNGVKREDLFQIHTYVAQYANNDEIGACGFIYPVKQEDLKKYHTTPILQNNKEIPFYILFLVIPEDKQDRYKFNTNIKNNCHDLIQQIKNLILKYH